MPKQQWKPKILFQCQQWRVAVATATAAHTHAFIDEQRSKEAKRSLDNSAVRDEKKNPILAHSTSLHTVLVQFPVHAFQKSIQYAWITHLSCHSPVLFPLLYFFFLQHHTHVISKRRFVFCRVSCGSCRIKHETKQKIKTKKICGESSNVKIVLDNTNDSNNCVLVRYAPAMESIS